jgi:hypothetical protein
MQEPINAQMEQAWASENSRTVCAWVLEANLHARLLSRTVLGSVVIDHEDVSRTFPEGPGQVELVCVYLVEKGKIQSASFSFGPPVLSKVLSSA